MNKKLSIYIFALLLLSMFAYAKVNLQNDYTFLNLKAIKDNTSEGLFGWGKGWWYYNPRSYDSMSQIDFSKAFWMPIEPWEYAVCSQDLSTKLVYEKGAGTGSTWSGIYDDAVTVAVYRLLPERNGNIDNTSLYEVSWYFHPAGKGKYYSLNLTNSVTGASKEIQTSTGAGIRSGASGYFAFYSVDVYDRAILMDESTPKKYLFYIINATDSGR